MYIYLISIYRWLKTSNVIYVHAQSLSHVWLFATLWTIACQAPLSMGFSRQEYQRGLPWPLPGDLPDPGTEPTSLASPSLVGGFFTTSTTWEAPYVLIPPLFSGFPSHSGHHGSLSWVSCALQQVLTSLHFIWGVYHTALDLPCHMSKWQSHAPLPVELINLFYQV